MNRQNIVSLAALAALGTGASLAQAQSSSVTVYGRVDLSVAQQADAAKVTELRNGSGSRFGVRGVEDLGDGLKAVFQIEHRFNADTGAQSNATRFWEGKAVVGLEGGFGRVTLGREENPAYTYSQTVADPWSTDTVASNGSIVNGRVGSTRYSNSVNWRYAAGPFTVGAQLAEAEGNESAAVVGDKRPYSLGVAWAQGPWRVGAGYENPAGREDHWATGNASYDFGAVRVGGFVGAGRNAAAQKLQAWLVSAVAPVGAGEFRTSYGQLKNKDVDDGILDRQFALGYHHALSKRTTVYTDLVNERRDNLPDERRKTGWDVGIKHNF